MKIFERKHAVNFPPLPVYLKQFTGYAAIILIFLTAGCSKIGEHAPDPAQTPIHPIDKPNIILVLGDDVGYEIPNYTGGESYVTPNIDNIAQEGMQFTRCHSTPLCSPSRFEMLTGKYNQRNYYTNSWGDLDRSQRTIANMLKDEGYATYASGKWQLNGGDTSLHDFGFDNYCISNPYKLSTNESGSEGGISLYKDPLIYTHGDYLADALTKGKYGEDIFRDSIFQFIDNNKDKPFFAYWATNLCHAPFQPTPDDPEFATFDPTKPRELGDTIYYPSMVKYFDKEMGLLFHKIDSLGIGEKTIILFVLGDNGTESDINSLYKGQIIPGGKGKAIENGIHVPFIVYWRGTVAPGRIDRNIVDFTDFLPSIAGLCNVKVPASYGIIDGVNFSPQVFGEISTPRQWSYCYYDVNRKGDDGKIPTIWSLDTMYKLYDHKRGFYNYILDPFENSRIRHDGATPQDNAARDRLQSVIDSYQ